MQLVAKLKAVFDRFDDNKQGYLTGVQVQQALLYMDKAVDSVQVSRFLKLQIVTKAYNLHV